jgi:hypothetical protein
MRQDLASQRCFNHAEREAVARCPGCRHYFCRECVTEHDDRVVCAACLRKNTTVPLLKRRGVLGTFGVVRLVLGLVGAWFFFYLAGERLLTLPASFHEGTLWKVRWWHEK